MKRSLPPEVERVKNWCLKEGRFEDASFIIDMKKVMESEGKLNNSQAVRLSKILSLYTLDIDLEEKIKEKLKSWRR